MTTRRRLFALVATFAVAFGALWPLVSVARFGPAEVPSVICTQGGFTHAPSSPADHDEKFHCPLCVVSMDVDLPVVAAHSAAPSALALHALHAPPASLHSLVLARPPPARAPPAFS